jgi:hypothetical protein
MDLMAVVAADCAELVDSPAPLKKVFLLLMARKTWLGTNYLILVSEGEDEPLSFCLRMFLPGTVAGFASFLTSGNFWIIDIAPMGIILFEGAVTVLVAAFARLCSHVAAVLGLLPFLTG